MTCLLRRPALALFVLLLGMVACDRDRATAPAAGSAQADARAPDDAAQPSAPTVLEDVVESTPRYIIGISYPKSANRYPRLAAELEAYANAARQELMTAVEGVGEDRLAAPYDLSLSFTELMDTPLVYAVAVDGTSYTGGAHGAPLVARFVWLPARDERLTSRKLVTTAAGWSAISRFVREQLQTALSQRFDADEVAPEDRAQLFKTSSEMIAAGTEGGAEAFAQFEPVAGEGGRLAGLRFVFPPYQVGPYSDGTQTVEVPAAILLPHVAPAYRGLFQGGAQPR
jgi:hypothetical protein